MNGSFNFIRNMFPEIAEDAQKAESYLYTDSAACTLYVSRVLDGIVKTACASENIPLKVDGKDRGLAELIDELAQRRIADKNTVRTMHSMRISRNKNAHNEDTSLKENTRLLKNAAYLCKWLKKRYSAPTASAGHKHIRISINNIMNEYKLDPSAASRKYEGRNLTLNGGKVLKAERSPYGDEKFIVTLVSPPREDSSGISRTYKAECFFPQSLESKINSIKPGQNFTATGTWQHNSLVNCVWKADNPRRSAFRLGEGGENNLLRGIFTVIAVILFLYLLLTGKL